MRFIFCFLQRSDSGEFGSMPEPKEPALSEVFNINIAAEPQSCAFKVVEEKLPKAGIEQDEMAASLDPGSKVEPDSNLPTMSESDEKKERRKDMSGPRYSYVKWGGGGGGGLPC